MLDFMKPENKGKKKPKNIKCNIIFQAYRST